MSVATAEIGTTVWRRMCEIAIITNDSSGISRPLSAAKEVIWWQYYSVVQGGKVENVGLQSGKRDISPVPDTRGKEEVA